MKSTLTLVCALMCTCVAAIAQGGSNYSAIGLGDMRRSVGALYDGMAGTAIAMPSDHGINIVNPALLGMSPFTRLQAGYRFNQQFTSQDQLSTRQNNGEIDGLMVLFAVDTLRGFGVSVGVIPYSSVNYLTERPLSTIVDGTPLTGRALQQGTGGTSAIQIGASGRIGNLYAGVSMQALFGVISMSEFLYVDAVNERVQSSTSYDVRGMLLRAGLFYRTSSVSLGGFVSAGPRGSMNTVYRATGLLGSSVYIDSTLSVAGVTDFPVSVGIGASTSLGRSTVGADLEFSDHSGVDVNPRADAAYDRSLRASIGYSLQAAHYAPTFWDKWGFRAGLSYQRMYYTFKGSPIHEYSAAAGFDFPLGQSATVDAAVQAGYRGPATGSVSEYFTRVTVTVSIGELWFRPFARD
jgi:hypothetical protein